MRRLVILPIAVAAMIALLPGESASAAQAPQNVLVVDIPGTTLADWTSAPMPALHGLIARGGVGLLAAARPHTPCFAAKDRNPEAAASIAAALRPAHLGMDYRDIPLLDNAFPTGTRTNLDKIASVVSFRDAPVAMVEIDDALRADCTVGAAQRDRWIRLTLQRADALIGSLYRFVEHNGTLIVMSSVAPRERGLKRDVLTAVAMIGPTIGPRSLLISSTTRRAGVVTLLDIPPTVARFAGVPAVADEGRVIRSARGSQPALVSLAQDYAHALMLRGPLLRLYVWLSCLAILIAVLVVLSGRGIARRTRLPRTGRDVAGIALSAIALMPATALLEPLAGIRGTTPAIIGVLGGAILAALAVRAIGGPRRAGPIAAAITVVTAIADLAAGGPLSSRSAISYSIASGPRFHGVGNELMGVVVATALVWAASALDRTARPRTQVFVVLGAMVALMAAPQVGAKFGSTFVAVPAFGVLGARAFNAGQRRLRTILGIAIATAFVAGVAALADFLSSPQTQTLIAHVAASRSTGVLSQKIGAALRLIAASYWTAAIIVGIGSVGFVAWRRPQLAGRGMWGRPFLRTAIIAGGVACVLSVAFNDAGVVAAAFIALIVAAAAAHVFLVENA